MPARTPYQAVAIFRGALSVAFSCVTAVVPKVDRYDPAKPLMLRCSDGSEVGLLTLVQYRVRPADGGWVVQTVAYVYALTDRDGRELLAYHWHPEWLGEVKFAHLHMQYQVLRRQWGIFEDKHLPTGLVALEEVLEMFIIEQGVTPHRSDWRHTLGQTRAELAPVQTWSGSV